jgi:NADH-quinone oxidoreductase subunit M
MAFSTVSHVGFVLVGAFSFNHFGLMGASFQQFNHGIASAAMFVLLSFYYQRGGGTNLSEMGGLKRQMPIFSTLFLVAMLCNLGLPLTSGFVGEFLALLGSFQSGMSGLYGLKVVVAAVAGLGAIFSASYMLYMFQRMFYGEAIDQREYKDINMREMALAGIFSFIILGLGIYPTPVLKAMEPTVLSLKNSVFPATDVTMVEMPKSSDKPRLSLTGGR